MLTLLKIYQAVQKTDQQIAASRDVNPGEGAIHYSPPIIRLQQATKFRMHLKALHGPYIGPFMPKFRPRSDSNAMPPRNHNRC